MTAEGDGVAWPTRVTRCRSKSKPSGRGQYVHVSDVSPAPAALNGQFVQMNVVSIVGK